MSSASSHDLRAATSRSDAIVVWFSMFPTEARCFAITPSIAAAFFWYPANEPIRAAISADLRYARPVISAVIAAA